MNNNPLFKTTDTALSTFLLVKDCILIEIDYNQPRYEYQFQDTPELRDLVHSYLISKGFADANTLIRINKKLLRIIHNKQQWGDD